MGFHPGAARPLSLCVTKNYIKFGLVTWFITLFHFFFFKEQTKFNWGLVTPT